MRHKETGLTLIELLIAIAIFGIIGILGLSAYLKWQSTWNETNSYAQSKMIVRNFYMKGLETPTVSLTQSIIPTGGAQIALTAIVSSTISTTQDYTLPLGYISVNGQPLSYIVYGDTLPPQPSGTQYKSPGTYKIPVPAGTSSLTATLLGAGGAGSTCAAGGFGGYVKFTVANPQPGNWSLVVGAGGAAGSGYLAGYGGGYSALLNPGGTYYGVAGGGGSAGENGGSCSASIGGNSGGTSGSNGIATPNCGIGYGNGGSALQPGAGGGACPGWSAPGVAGAGMIGGISPPAYAQYGNGGGGDGGDGWFGGGSGGGGGGYQAGSSGGGGSSYLNPRTSNTQDTAGGGSDGGSSGGYNAGTNGLAIIDIAAKHASASPVRQASPSSGLGWTWEYGGQSGYLFNGKGY
jgi:prepilin-type N-terminal cleavage/methylation domain-containing protein